MDDPFDRRPPIAVKDKLAIAGGLLMEPAMESAIAPQPRSLSSSLILCIGLALIAFNLRPVFSSLSMLLPEVRASTGLGFIAMSGLTTLPVLCLGLFAPLAPPLARRFGNEWVLLGTMLLVGLGTALRGLDNVFLLYFGTALAGFAIALGNTLLPAVVKRDFPGSTALITGLYVMALCGGAASGAAFTLPIEANLAALGAHEPWRAALACWAAPALLAAIAWSVQLRRIDRPTLQATYRIRGLWRDPIAWQLTLFMGLQSALAYIVFGWLAPILRLRGIDGVTAGFVVSLSIMMQVLASIFVPLLGAKARDQRGINIVLVLLAVFGLIGMMFGPSSMIWLFALPQGIGQGGLFAIAMTMIILRSPDARVASELSGMAQGGGYTLASAGPLLMGVLIEKTNGFAAPAVLIVTLGFGAACAGLGAGRTRLVKIQSSL